MTKWKLFALSVVLIGSAGGCESKAEKARRQAAALQAREQRVEARLARVEQTQSTDQPVARWIMPPVLAEISGIALTRDGRLLAHDDELSRIFEIDPRRGVILKSFMVGDGLHGDFEAITVVGDEIYLLQSNGHLFRFREGANGAHVPYRIYDTKLGKECEFEGLAYEKDSARLVLPCKKAHLKHLDDELVIYRMKIADEGGGAISMFSVPLTEVIADNNWKKFRPSDITIDPATGNYVMISSLDKGLVVMTPSGEVVHSRKLPGAHQQAEGVAITSDGIVIISDEATSNPATITLYKWNRSESEPVSQ